MMQNDNNMAASDVKRISGIGPTYAEALQAIGVRRVADLARFDTATELQQALQEQAGIDVPLWKIENNDWLGQARRLAEEMSTEEETSSEPTVTVRGAEEAETSTAENWRQHAGFSVFFDYVEGEGTWQTRVWQTRTYHDESGEEQLFAGVDPDPWVSWIMEKAGLGETAPDELVFTVKETPDEAVEIVALDLFESQPSFGVLQGKLTADVRFQVMDEALTATGAPFRMEVYLVETEARSTELVASAEGHLQPDETKYRIQAEFPFAPEGRYRLHCIVFLLPPVSRLAVREEHVVKFVS